MENYLLVADVLGFSKMVSNSSDEILPERIDTWIRLVEEVSCETKIEKIQLISDTIFAKVTDSELEPERLFRFAQLLLERGMENSFPIRGAITYGEVSWGSLIYGKAVIEAYRLERSLDWIGIACGQLPKVPWSWELACCYPVPKKDGMVQLSAAIVWNMPAAKEFIKQSTSGGLMQAGEIFRWEHYTKQLNTLNFSQYIRHAMQAGFDPERYPYQMPLQFYFD